MATQRITVAKVAGAAGRVVVEQFRLWVSSHQGGEFPAAVRREVDQFAQSLRANASAPPIVYFAEWIDMWSMGDEVPGLGAPDAAVVCGERFQACCHELPITHIAQDVGDGPAQESLWLEARLREAESAWDELAGESVLVVLRDVLGGTVLDEELSESLHSVPSWLAVPGDVECERYEARRKAQLDYKTGLKVARLEGEEVGLAKGRGEGKIELIHAFERVLRRPQTPSEQLAGLTLEELTRLADELQGQVLK